MAQGIDDGLTWNVLDMMLMDDIPNGADVSLNTVSEFLADLEDFGVKAVSKNEVKSKITKPKTNSNDSSPRDTASVPTKRIRTSPKEELEYLQSKHRYLISELRKLQAATAMTTNDPWQKRAKSQAQAAQRAIQENTRLKAALEDQIKVIQALEKVFQKKPRLTEAAAEKIADLVPWRRSILGLHNREGDLEALLRYQYDKLDTEFIRRKVYHMRDNMVGDELVRSEQVESSNDNIIIHLIRCKQWSINFIEFSQILWGYISLNVRMPTKIKVDSELLQSFKNDTIVYTRHLSNGMCEQLKIPPLEGRTAAMRFEERDRVVIVWKSIVDDALVPFRDDYVVKDNKMGWALITADGPNECKVAVYSTLTTPVFPNYTSGTMTEIILNLYKANSTKFDNAISAAVEERKKVIAQKVKDMNTK
ncbi:hypothetical protein THRCLA_06125 [Thraustotheca clavata]|uniref:START domain-containing protein n=1 Tax=Thraustotheca clavata TaxID=74557 RepID=A0A1V9ZQC7_9STRA|nr:hypothetical protein THRCLA_06125 [Thraustotheca clavata]